MLQVAYAAQWGTRDEATFVRVAHFSYFSAHCISEKTIWRDNKGLVPWVAACLCRYWSSFHIWYWSLVQFAAGTGWPGTMYVLVLVLYAMLQCCNVTACLCRYWLTWHNESKSLIQLDACCLKPSDWKKTTWEHTTWAPIECTIAHHLRRKKQFSTQATWKHNIWGHMTWA